MSFNHFLPPLTTVVHEVKPREIENKKVGMDEKEQTAQRTNDDKCDDFEPLLPAAGTTCSEENDKRDDFAVSTLDRRRSCETMINDEQLLTLFKHNDTSEKWPQPFDDKTAQKEGNTKELPSSYDEIRKQVEHTGKIVVRVITWNQEARDLPGAPQLIQHLIPSRLYHVIAVGTQECENDFCRSIINPSKAKWEMRLAETVGMDYEMVRCHTLQASHIAVCIHKAILHLVSDIKSHAVPTGVYDTLGNKGGIGVSLKIGASSYCFMNAHLAAHQNQMSRRCEEFMKISHEVAEAIGSESVIDDGDDAGDDESDGTASNEGRTDSDAGFSLRQMSNDSRESDGSFSCKKCQKCFGPRSCTTCSSCRGQPQQQQQLSQEKKNRDNPLTTAFDYVFWAGDMNFRINGTRRIIDNLLRYDRYSILMNNDQLSILMQFDPLFAGFVEGPITFRPTYKFDRESDEYDTSPKRRIPSWTDRILYKAHKNVDLISYSSAQDIRSSDHRPVYSTFNTKINLEDGWIRDHRNSADKLLWSRETKSEVCVIS